MRRSRGLAALTIVGISAVVAMCIYPTEHDSSVRVSIRPLKILLRGSDSTARATAWQIVAPGDSQKIPNISFVWSSSNPDIATVDQAGHIVGVNSGTVIIRAAARNFDAAALAGADTLRVSSPLEIDSVRPQTVRYGEKLTIYGVGVDSIFLTSLAGASLIHVPFSDTVFRVGTARTRFWVPPPATTDSLFFLGFSGGQGVFGFVHGDTTRVIERDIYEPNDTSPSVINLDAARPFPNTVLDSLLFFNPALAFEALKRGQTSAADLYHFTQGATRNLTIILTAPQIARTFSTFLTDSLGWNGTAKRYVIGHDSWTFGPGSHASRREVLAVGRRGGFDHRGLQESPTGRAGRNRDLHHARALRAGGDRRVPERAAGGRARGRQLLQRRGPARYDAGAVSRFADDREPARRRLDPVPLHQRGTLDERAVPPARVSGNAPGFLEGPRPVRHERTGARGYRGEARARRHGGRLGRQSDDLARDGGLLPGSGGFRGHGHDLRGMRGHRPVLGRRVL